MKKMLFIFSVLILTAIDSNAQTLLLKLTPNTNNKLSVGILPPKSNLTEIEVDVMGKGTTGSSIHSILQKSNSLGLPVIFFQELRKADEIGAKQPISLTDRLMSESEKLFQKFVIGIAFFHFLIDEEVVKKNSYSIQASNFKFNPSFEVKPFQTHQ